MQFGSTTVFYTRRDLPERADFGQQMRAAPSARNECGADRFVRWRREFNLAEGYAYNRGPRQSRRAAPEEPDLF
jgi:hypothetical protein